MMKRICPFCKSALTASSIYFCEYCGNELPDTLHAGEIDHKRRHKIFQKERKNKLGDKIKESSQGLTRAFSMRSVVAGIVLGISISISFFLFFEARYSFLSSGADRPSSTGPIPLPKTENKIENKDIAQEILDMDIPLNSGPFGRDDVYTYIPYDTPLYLEINDISTLEPYFGFMGGDLFTLWENIKGKTKSSYSAFFYNKGITSGWVIVAFLNEKDISLGTYKEITVDTMDDVLIISSNPILMDEVKLAKSEIIKNLNIHPVLISIQPFLPTEGNIFILKSTDNGDSAVEELIRQTLSEELKSVLENFRRGQTTYLVIK